MSLERPRTGHERNPDEFRFSGLKIPPDAVLPPALRKLTAELRAHQQKHRDAEQKHGELTHPNTLRTAQQSDALLLGEAVRNDQDDPGPVNETALKEAIEAEQQTMARHEAAGRLVAQELDVKLKAAAEKGATEARTKIDQAREQHAKALADLDAARQTMVTFTAALGYWQSVLAGEPTRWQGRRDGRGSSIVGAHGQRVSLEPFSQMTSALRKEADRLAAAVDPPAEETPDEAEAA